MSFSLIKSSQKKHVTSTTSRSKNWSIFSNQNGKCNQVEDAWKVGNF
jgi:hypothetical protein